MDRKTLALLPAVVIVLGLAAYACKSGGGDSTSVSSLDPRCASDTDDPPQSLACTGLYASLGDKTLSQSARAYAPAVPLWSDGAEKLRWISLPQGAQIDTSDPNEWKFPNGTKAWKEFSRDGKRVETRYFHKDDTGTWSSATYVWNADESDATRGAGGDIMLPSGTAYHVPTKDECTQCHRGRTDRLLGFEQVSLGLPGATGVTLDVLAKEGSLTQPPALTTLSIGDDGTGMAATTLPWLHINCGTSCHNENSNSIAWAAKMHLRLDATKLDGRSSVDFEPRTTTIGVVVDTPQWSGETRIVSGDPANSLLLSLIGRREKDNQMPPLATNVVDDANVAQIKAWITKMPLAKHPDMDAGVDAAPPVDAGSDATAIDPSDAGDEGGTGSTDAAPE